MTDLLHGAAQAILTFKEVAITVECVAGIEVHAVGSIQLS